MKRPPAKKRPGVWLLYWRAVAAWYALIGGWWAVTQVNVLLVKGKTLIPAIPEVNRAAWVERPAWVFVGVAVLLFVGRLLERPQMHRYGTAKWNAAFEAAGLIKDPAGKDAPAAPRARMIGRVRVVDDAVLVILRLPPGLTVAACAAKADGVAAALDVPVERLHLSRHEGRSGVLLARIDPPPLSLAPREVLLPEETLWRDKVLLGRDGRGRDVHAPTWDVGSWLVGGINGSGKTTLLRLLAAHYALDEGAAIWGCDGKGSRDDWGPLRPRVARWVDITDPQAAADYLTLLRDAVDEVLSRNGQGGREWPGLLVLLEEATALRAALSSQEQAEADKLLTRLVQTGRSANVLTVVAAQRPSASLMSSNVRAQANVGVCMRVRSMVDAEMVLGYRPEVALPDKVGHALVDVGDGTPRTVLVDHLTETGWRDLCARWVPVRAVPDLADADAWEGEADEPEDVEVDPLLSEVASALLAAQRPLTAGELWAVLPEELRRDDPRRLGVALSGLGLVALKRRIDGVQGRYYDLDSLSPLLAPGPVPPGTLGHEVQDAVGP